MKKFLLFVAALAVSAAAFAGNAKKQQKLDADTESFRYDIEYVKTVGDGISSVKVWSFSKKPELALKQCRKNAVHGVIFKGYTGTGSSHAALAKSPTAWQDHADYFTQFFAEGGEWQRYVAKADASTAETVLVGKKECKVGEVVQVNVKALRQALEKAGVIKGLSFGF